jgi:molybdopterin converting factor small subunit
MNLEIRHNPAFSVVRATIHAGEEIRIESGAGPLSAALSRLWAECPALRDRVITELGEVRPHVNIFVDGEDIRYAGGLAAPVRDGSEIFLIAAVSGG